MQQAAGMLDSLSVHIRLRHDVRININQKHTKGNRNQKQRLKSFFNCQIQEHAGNQNHHVVSPLQIVEGCLLPQIDNVLAILMLYLLLLNPC